MSDIFPHVAQCADEISFIRSMHTDIPEHAGAMMMMMNVGALQPPTSWASIMRSSPIVTRPRLSAAGCFGQRGHSVARMKNPSPRALFSPEHFPPRFRLGNDFQSVVPGAMIEIPA